MQSMNHPLAFIQSNWTLNLTDFTTRYHLHLHPNQQYQPTLFPHVTYPIQLLFPSTLNH